MSHCEVREKKAARLRHAAVVGPIRGVLCSTNIINPWERARIPHGKEISVMGQRCGTYIPGSGELVPERQGGRVSF